MHSTLSPYWILVEHHRGRTADHQIMARSHWSAWWLGCQLWGQQNVVHVREVKGYGGDHVDG
jgi:hypothetical protein